MMPNVPQYPVAVAAILRAGCVVVNVNPLYTPRELEHQLKDSGAKAIVIIENFATTLQQCIAATPVKHVVLAAMGDHARLAQGRAGQLRGAQRQEDGAGLQPAGRGALQRRARAGPRGTLQRSPRSGPTTSRCCSTPAAPPASRKGAVLLHRNVIANVLQSEAWNEPVMEKVPAGEQPTSVCALPLYHIFAFTVNMMLSMRTGGKLILIPNPRDLPAVLKELSKHTFHSFPAVNTLFNGAGQPSRLQHRRLEEPQGLASAAAWRCRAPWPSCGSRRPAARSAKATACRRPRPSATCNPTTSTAYTGTIGVPLPSTDMKLLDDDGHEVPLGSRGEIAIKGPQVMAGYWQRPDETAKVMTPDGFFKTGDIGVVDERGYFKIVDRKKDMILVSGFNVYPNEVEDVVAQMAGVLECAAVGVPDEKTGEAVKLVIVKKDPSLTEADGARLLRGQPHRLQAAQGGRVPHRAAEDAGRQDPAPRTARQELSAVGLQRAAPRCAIRPSRSS